MNARARKQDLSDVPNVNSHDEYVHSRTPGWNSTQSLQDTRQKASPYRNSSCLLAQNEFRRTGEWRYIAACLAIFASILPFPCLSSLLHFPPYLFSYLPSHPSIIFFLHQFIHSLFLSFCSPTFITLK